MTDEKEIRLEILKAVIPTASRHGIERAQIIPACEYFYNFVMKPPADVSKDTRASEPKKK